MSLSDYSCRVISEATTTANERAVRAHRETWGEPDFAVRAPGRVNLIGEHTDYNDGFCLPMALPFDTVIAVSRSNQAALVEISSEGFGTVAIRADEPKHPIEEWAKQIAGVIWLLQSEGIQAGGWNGTIASDIPTGASLSSSAAIEVAAISVVLNLRGLEWSPLKVAELGQRAEIEVVGIPTGIMDQFISAGAELGHAGLLDCRDLTLTPVPLPNDLTVAVMDTGTRRRLAEMAYGERRSNCEAAASRLGLKSLRDADIPALAGLPADMDLELRRATHVVTENARTLAAVEAMKAGDSVLLGTLMSESHVSLRDDFEVSSVALDRIVEAATNAPGCLGARMTGGGFAGCAVAILKTRDRDQFRSAVEAAYSYQDPTDGTKHRATIWFCEPQAGAGLDPILSA